MYGVLALGFGSVFLSLVSDCTRGLFVSLSMLCDVSITVVVGVLWIIGSRLVGSGSLTDD